MLKYVKILYKRQFTGYNTTEPRSVLFSISQHQQTSANAKNAILDIDWILDDIGWYYLCYWRNGSPTPISLLQESEIQYAMVNRSWKIEAVGYQYSKPRLLQKGLFGEFAGDFLYTNHYMERSYWGQWFLNCFKLGLPHYMNLYANCEVFTQVHMYYVRNVN